MMRYNSNYRRRQPLSRNQANRESQNVKPPKVEIVEIPTPVEHKVVIEEPVHKKEKSKGGLFGGIGNIFKGIGMETEDLMLLGLMLLMMNNDESDDCQTMLAILLYIFID